MVRRCFEGSVSRNGDEVNDAIADDDTAKGQASKSRKLIEGYYCHGGGEIGPQRLVCRDENSCSAFFSSMARRIGLSGGYQRCDSLAKKIK